MPVPLVNQRHALAAKIARNRKPLIFPTIRAEVAWTDTATAAGITVKARAPVLELCRRLIEAGHHPDSPLVAWRESVLCLRVKSIGAAAELAVEDDRFG